MQPPDDFADLYGLADLAQGSRGTAPRNSCGVDFASPDGAYLRQRCGKVT